MGKGAYSRAAGTERFGIRGEIMSNMNFFYSSMSSVLSQWSDFRVSKNLYKEYFAMQKENNTSSAENAVNKYINEKTKSRTQDKLKTYSDNLTAAVEKAEKAFEADTKTGEIDTDKAYSAASDFVDSYNQLVSSIRTSGNMAVSNRSEYIANMTNAYTRKLAAVGITTNSDGTLKLDKEVFAKADEKAYNDVFGKNSFASYMKTQAKGLSAYSQTNLYQESGSYPLNKLTEQNSSNNVTGYLFDKLF